MRKNVFILIFLIFIVGLWVVSRFWFHEPGGNGDSSTVSSPATTQSPAPDRNPDTDPDPDRSNTPQPVSEEEERLLAQQREAEITARREAVLEEGELLFRGYFYDEVITLLNEDEELINYETQALEIAAAEAKDGLVLFDGDIKHIFFHSLIIYPEYLFPDLSVPTGGYNEGFIFQSEFIKILPQLLERGYVLYDINDIFSKDADGVMRQNDIYLPPGKRPLVLSIDDPSYHYNKTTPGRIGFANRVILDEEGELATEVPAPSGEIEITYDGDVHIAVDAFVRENPEFSYRGAKGIIASTGYMGIFGYDLQSEQSRQEATAISDKFKENGWLFANHSYTHNRVGFWGPESNPANIRYDVRRWREVIEPIVGQTNIFIAPFGFLLRGEGMQVIIDNGYDIYCTVDFNQPITVHSTHAVMGRIEIGGYSLVRWVNTLNRDFFDVASVKDRHRPPILSR